MIKILLIIVPSENEKKYFKINKKLIGKLTNCNSKSETLRSEGFPSHPDCYQEER